MYICNRCGNLCCDCDLPTYTEDYGFETGVGWRSCPQTFVDSCSCGGDFVEASRCKLCDEYFDDEHYNGICDVCLDENATYENALLIGEENADTIEINSFLLNSFTKEQIEEILKRELEQARKIDKAKIDKDAKEYCLDDKGWFAEWLDKNQ